jgi:large subunit ribosomal protein LP0
MAEKKVNKVDKKAKKLSFQKKLTELLIQYEKILLVSIDNVGANNLQKTRQSLRGQAVLLFGRNTMIRKTIRDYVEKCTEAGNKEGARIEALLPFVKGNVGLIFSNGDLNKIKEIAESYKQKAPAKIGAVAPEDVFVEPGPTGMEPTQTQFLQALNIASKIVKGQVEIINRIHLIKEGEKIGTSEATLLDKLNIMPFSYRASVRTVFDAGFVYPVSLLSLGTNDVLQMLARGVQRVATIALELGIPTIASIPHIIANAYKNIINISIETEYEFEGSKDVKAYLKDPSAFASSAPVQEHVASNNSNVVATTAPQEEEKKDEKDEESQSIGGIFGSEEEN